MGTGVSDTAPKPSGYPTVFNLLLILVVPLGFVTATFAMIAALPIGELAYRIAAAALVALIPLFLAFRASAELKRRRLRGLARAPIAIVLILLGDTAIVGALYQWRGFRPPDLIRVADHLHRVYLLGESPEPLAAIEPRPPLYEIYDHNLPVPSAAEQVLLSRDAKPGVSGIEIWSTDGHLRARFLGPAAHADQVTFLDDHRVLAVRSTGGAVLLDADKNALLRSLDVPEPLVEVQVQTSTHALVVSGKVETSGEIAVHYFDLESGERTASFQSKTYQATAVTADLRRILIVDRTRKGELLLSAFALPTGQPEANFPKAILVDAKRRKLKAITSMVALGDGEQAMIFQGTSAQIWDVIHRKPLPFALTKTKLYPYAVAPGGRTYFHRRVDAGDPNPTGLYRLPAGTAIDELPTRGQPPRAFFLADGRSVAVGPVVLSTANGRLIAGTMPDAFSLDRDRFIVPARDGSAFLTRGDGGVVTVENARLSRTGVVPLRSEDPGAAYAVSNGGKLCAVLVVYPAGDWWKVLEQLDRWQPPPST